MSSKTRKVITVALLGLIATAAVSWTSILTFIVRGGLQQVQKNGTNLSWSGLTTGASSFSLDSLTLLIPGPRVKGAFALPITVELTQLSVALNVSSLFALSPSVTYSTQLYGGTVSGEAQQGSAATQLNVTVNNVEIGNHPQLSSVGVRGGAINGSLQDLLITPRGPEGGTFSFQIRELAIPVVEVTRTLLRTDKLGTVDLDVEGTVSPTKVEMSNIRLSSIFGSVVGSLVASDHLVRSPSVSGSFEVSLSENGMTTLGPWLPLLPGASLDASTSAFVVAVSSTPCSAARASVTTVRLSSGCLKLVFDKR